MTRSIYTVDQAVRDTGTERAAIIALFKAISARGVADFKIGRRGHPSRLES